MFNDERIDAECGKIYGKGVLLAVIITLIYVISRTVTLIIQGTLQTFVTYTEAVILILGIGILLRGALLFERKGDERVSHERHSYYRKAGKAFIIAVFGTYILTIPFTTEEMLGGQPHNHLLILLEVIGFLFVFYSFKAKEINFNYSFIAEKGFHYYSRVFMIIGGLWLGLFVPFILAAAWELVLHKSLAGALTIFLAYISSAIGLSIEYFFVSLIEKLSYESSNGCQFALGTRIAMIVCLVVEFSSALLQCVYVYFVTGNLREIPDFGEYGTIVAMVSRCQKQINFLLIVLTGLILCHIISQVKKGTLLYSVCRIKMLLLAISAFQETLMPVWYRAVPEDALRFLANNVDPWMRFGSFLISIALWFIFVRAMAKELGASRVLWVIPVLHIITPIVNIFLHSQSMLREAVCCETIITMGCLILLTHIMWRYRGFSSEDQEITVKK